MNLFYFTTALLLVIIYIQESRNRSFFLSFCKKKKTSLNVAYLWYHGLLKKIIDLHGFRS
jgi:hypothetical protein